MHLVSLAENETPDSLLFLWYAYLMFRLSSIPEAREVHRIGA